MRREGSKDAKEEDDVLRGGRSTFNILFSHICCCCFFYSPQQGGGGSLRAPSDRNRLMHLDLRRLKRGGDQELRFRRSGIQNTSQVTQIGGCHSCRWSRSPPAVQQQEPLSLQTHERITKKFNLKLQEEWRGCCSWGPFGPLHACVQSHLSAFSDAIPPVLIRQPR